MQSISALRTERATTVSEFAGSGFEAWDSYVRAHEGASVYHLAAWRDVIESVFGRDTHYLAAERDGELCGVLPMVRLKSRAFGDFLVSMPYVNYGGVLADGQPFLVMELAEGEELHAWLRNQRPSLQRRLAVFTGICAAVGYAHSHLIVHRDLKPGNIRVDAHDRIKLLDFGIAKLAMPGESADGARQLTMSGSTVGTPVYMSPEQAKGKAAGVVDLKPL